MDNKTNKTDIRSYDEIAYNVFLPIFPMIADEALSLHGRKDGRCLDIGCGGGLFGYMVELISNMDVTFLDVQESSLEVCRKRGESWGLTKRSSYILSDVHDMNAIADGSFELIISRGSLPFWGIGEEFIQAFREIDRVLAPGGTAMIGGSLGFPDMKDAISRTMRERDPEWAPPGNRQGSCVAGYDERAQILRDAGIKCEPRVTDKGHWIVIKK